MKTYIFDVDGVLALPNQPIESHFMRMFEHWMLKKEVYICTNNTYQNIMPRLGRRIIDNCQAVFTSGGNSIWKENKEHVVSNWRPSYELISFLESLLKMSEFKMRTGPNIEYRTGMISFSLIGKTASEDEIKRYQQWDKISKEKKTFAESIKKAFPNLGICFGSDTSIDISESCYDKANIYNFLKFKTNVTSICHSTYGVNKETQERIKNITEQAMSINKKAVYNTIISNSPEDTQKYLRM
jgi:phosphomannomutase